MYVSDGLNCFIAVQVEMHAFWRNDRVMKWCNQQGIHVTAYAPISSPHMAASMEKGHLNLLQVEIVSTVLPLTSFPKLSCSMWYQLSHLHVTVQWRCISDRMLPLRYCPLICLSPSVHKGLVLRGTPTPSWQQCHVPCEVSVSAHSLACGQF